jgi:hypothetical protein
MRAGPRKGQGKCISGAIFERGSGDSATLRRLIRHCAADACCSETGALPYRGRRVRAGGLRVSSTRRTSVFIRTSLRRRAFSDSSLSR